MITQNEYLVLKSLNDQKNGDISFPKGMDKRVFSGILRSLHNRNLAQGAFIEGGEFEAARIRNEGISAIFEYESEMKQNKNKLMVDLNSLSELEYDVLEHLEQFDDFTDSKLSEMSQEEYEEVCDYLEEQGLVEITATKDAYFVILNYKGRKILNNIRKNKIRQEAVTTKEDSADSLISDTPYMRVQLELFKLLLAKAGVDVSERIESKSGNTNKPRYNQTAVAKLFGYLIKNSNSLQGKNISSIKKLLSIGIPIDPKHHQQDINAINTLFADLGLDWKIV